MEVLHSWTLAGHTLRAGLVSTPAERLACLRLRYREYHDVQGAVPTSIDGLDRDWADAHSTMLCTILDEDPSPIGTMRLIDCAKGCLLTHGCEGGPARFSAVPYSLPQQCPLTGHPVEARDCVEGSRYVARIIELGAGVRVIHSNLLLEAASRWCELRGIGQIVGALREHQFHNLEKDGFPVVETHARTDGEPHRYHGMEYRAVSMPMTGARLSLRRLLAAKRPARVAEAA